MRVLGNQQFFGHGFDPRCLLHFLPSLIIFKVFLEVNFETNASIVQVENVRLCLANIYPARKLKLIAITAFIHETATGNRSKFTFTKRSNMCFFRDFTKSCTLVQLKSGGYADEKMVFHIGASRMRNEGMNFTQSENCDFLAH